eukprot:EC838259.1.p3 GENE.EC838259.1~~EC838259.1.p3  ORF type:complete len:57 (+),score=2.39 EC838259.1:304-474(+)
MTNEKGRKRVAGPVKRPLEAREPAVLDLLLARCGVMAGQQDQLLCVTRNPETLENN